MPYLTYVTEVFHGNAQVSAKAQPAAGFVGFDCFDCSSAALVTEHRHCHDVPC